jgi:hypothetical protein
MNILVCLSSIIFVYCGSYIVDNGVLDIKEETIMLSSNPENLANQVICIIFDKRLQKCSIETLQDGDVLTTCNRDTCKDIAEDLKAKHPNQVSFWKFKPSTQSNVLINTYEHFLKYVNCRKNTMKLKKLK